VVKPAISASGYRTHALSLRDPEAKSIFSEIAAHGDFLLQPFQPSILETGEVSMAFFDNVYSHAVLKRPRTDDFRVQAEHGGTESAHDPDPSVIQAAQQILDKTGMPWLYARVDGLVVVGEFHLMELELIEPDLFLDSHPDARSRFVSAILTKLN
jgi:glutathione synthase/RimK-type ligase-like ATP-grasp enzyme